jgi:hypothetical protein
VRKADDQIEIPDPPLPAYPMLGRALSQGHNADTLPPAAQMRVAGEKPFQIDAGRPAEPLEIGIVDLLPRTRAALAHAGHPRAHAEVSDAPPLRLRCEQPGGLPGFA